MTDFNSKGWQIYLKNTIEDLEKILQTPVSEKIIYKLNEKERELLHFKIRNAKYFLSPTEEREEPEFIEEVEIIKSILNNGKKRLPIKQHYGTGQYLSIKYNQKPTQPSL